MKLNQDNIYTIDIENFLDKLKNKPRFVLIDKNGNQIIPMIKESTQLINEFVLSTKYDLEKSFDDVESYCNSVSSSKKDYKIFTSVKDKNSDRIAYFGSLKSNIIYFDEKTVLAKGGDGSDIYIIDSNSSKIIEINNSANNIEKIDTISLLITEALEVSLHNDNLLIKNSDRIIEVQGYFKDEKHRHLIITNKEHKTFVPYIEENRVRLLPVIHPTLSQNVFILPTHSDEEIAVINCRKEGITFSRDQNNLFLMRKNYIPFILKIENFFSSERKINVLLLNKGIFSTVELPCEGEIEYYQDKIQNDYNRIVKDYIFDSKSSSIVGVAIDIIISYLSQ